jgi:anti-sigma regulatory factor (Ser/Thr protein kinase)
MSDSDGHSSGRGHPAATPPGLSLPFDGFSLVALRATVAAHADLFGLPGHRIGDLVMIAHELATNVVRHGGGHGRLRMWLTGNRVMCEVSDAGPGIANPQRYGHARPEPAATSGRGLWIVRQLADDFRLRSGSTGTTATVALWRAA